MEHIKGAIRIEKYDAVFEDGEWIPVGAPVDTVEKTNGLQALRASIGVGVAGSNGDYFPYIGNYDNWVTSNSELAMWISELSAKAPCGMPGGLAGTTDTGPYWGQAGQQLVNFGTFQEFTYNDDPDVSQNLVLTLKYRFNPDTGRTRNIRAIGLWATTPVSLDTAFQQGSAQAPRRLPHTGS